MDTLELNGKEYVKVSVAAKQTGYSSDYIGQLVRAGKIEGQLVGRSWYVRKDAVMQYKKGTPRSNFEKTRQDVKTAIERESGAARMDGAGAEGSAFFGAVPEYRKRLLNHSINYQKDEETLIPLLQRHSDVASLLVKSDDEEADEEATEIEENHTVEEKESTYEKGESPVIRWNGAVIDNTLDIEEEGDKNEDDGEVAGHTSFDRTVPTESLLHTSDLINRKNYHSRTADFYHIPISKTKSPATYVSKLPILLTTVVTLVILLGSVFLQNVWTFERGSGSLSERPALFERFEIASVSSLIQAYNSKK